jgi:hypothetical protein
MGVKWCYSSPIQTTPCTSNLWIFSKASQSELTRNEKVWGSIPQGGSKRSFCIIKSHSSDLGADCMIHLNHLQLEWQIDFALL